MADGAGETGGVKIAVISAVTAILTAGITAFTTLRTTNQRADNAVETATAKAQQALESAGVATTQAAAAANAVSSVRCPIAITRANFGETRTYVDQVRNGAEASTRQLLNVTGPGCLIAGAVLGYYFRSSASGDNFTVTIDVDGAAFAYPPKDGTQPALAYAQDDGGQNTGVLILPTIAYSKSLRISYWYVGNERQLSAYALVANQ